MDISGIFGLQFSALIYRGIAVLLLMLRKLFGTPKRRLPATTLCRGHRAGRDRRRTTLGQYISHRKTADVGAGSVECKMG
jgi:hypothetical protein